MRAWPPREPYCQVTATVYEFTPRGMIRDVREGTFDFAVTSEELAYATAMNELPGLLPPNCIFHIEGIKRMDPWKSYQGEER